MTDSVEQGCIQILEGIQKALISKNGFLVGRFGTIEFDICWESENGFITKDMAFVLERNAGVFPSSIESITKWVSATKEAFQAADILATGWYAPIVNKETTLLASWGSAVTQVKLRSLEPYYCAPRLRWTNVLDGHRVCVVSSFTASMSKQIDKGERKIWPGAGDSIWPRYTEWSWVNTGYAPSMSLGRCSWEEDPESWEDAVRYVVERVMETGARIVLIGCGGLGMVIAGELKKRGKICIVMGGAIQVLFGMKGGRWKNHDVISKMWNDEWVYPSLEETPACAWTVENSCYWSSQR
jgi:hypothetical protein